MLRNLLIFILLLAATVAIFRLRFSSSSLPVHRLDSPPVTIQEPGDIRPARTHSEASSALQPPESSPSVAARTVDHLFEQDLVPFRRVGANAVGFGDIVLGQLNSDLGTLDSGATDAPRPKYWPDGIVPYRIDPGIKDVDRIREAIRELQNASPFRFIEHETEPDFVVFTPSSECLSYLGRIGGGQEIFLDERCDSGDVLHEILHALGLIHEHSRSDRDRFVEVDWEMIEPGKEMQFAKLPAFSAEIYTHTAFDFRSIMLYRPTAFAREPGGETLRSKTNEPIDPTQDQLSEGDRRKLALLFERTR